MNAAERCAAALLCLLLCSTAVYAQDDADDPVWDFSGYFRSLLIRGATMFGEDYTLVTQRLRTQLTVHPTRAWEIVAALDNQALWGDYLGTREYALVHSFVRGNYLDLSLDPVDNTDLRWTVEPYRLSAHYFGEDAEVSVGRQRIAWGSGRIWNPTDLFNPTSPLAIEASEKRGTDGVWLLLRPIEGWTLETAGAIGTDDADVRLGARLGTTIGSYDLHVMAGRFRHQRVIGFDFSGYLGDSGFRGEFTRTEDGDRDFLRAVISLEYTFPNGLDLLTEYLYNGGALGSGSAVNLADFAAYDAITTLNRHFLALQTSIELHPLVTATAVAIADLADGSYFLSPALSWSALQDVDIVFGAQVFAGDRGEFSRYRNAAFLMFSWYFD